MELIPKQLGYFQIRGHIGRNDASLLYLAIDTRDNQEVFLTILDPRAPYEPEFLQRFLQQGQAATKLQHPNLVQVREAGLLDQHYYVAAAAVPGVTLAHVLRQRNSPMPPDETADIINQVAAALDYAHDHGFLHQNLSPNDIWLTRDGAALVTGVGLARRYIVNVSTTTDYDAETIVNPIHITPFLAPEQARGEFDVDRRADVYSLGAIAYTMLVGRPPFDETDQFLLLNEVIHGTPPAPEAVTPNVPAGMAFVLKFVLSKEANLRYAKAGEFATALNQGKMWRASSVTTATNGNGSLAGNAPASASHQWRRRVGALLALLALVVGVGAVATGAIYRLDMFQGIAASASTEEATPLASVELALATPIVDPSTPTPDTLTGLTLSDGQILDTVNTPTPESLPTAALAAVLPASAGVTTTVNITPATGVSTAILSPTITLTQTSANGVESSSSNIMTTTEVALAVTATETSTPVSTDTATSAPTATATELPTATETPTATPTDTVLPTATDTVAPPATATPTPTSTPTEAVQVAAVIPTEPLLLVPTDTPVATATATDMPVPTATNTPLPTDTPVPTATNTPLPTDTPVPTATNTPLPTDTPVPTATNTPLPTDTPVPTATNTPLPTDTPVPTATNTPLPTDTPVPTATNTPLPTKTPTKVATTIPTSTRRPTATSTRRPTATKTPIPLPTPTSTPLDTPTPVPTATPTLAPTPTTVPLLVGRVTLVQGANNDWVARITGQGEPGSTVQALIDNQPANAVQARANGAWTLNVPLAEPGEYAVSVIAELANGTQVEANSPPAVVVVPTPAPPPPPAGNAQLIQPGENEGGGGERRFQWKADFAPAEGQGFEVVFWRPGQDPMANGFGLASPTTGDSVSVNLDALDDQLGPMLDPGEYQWGVLLVQTSPYQRLRFLGDAHKFNFARGGDSGSSGGSSGSGPSSGE